MMTLNQCNKADLLWLVQRLSQMVDPSNPDYYLRRALSELDYAKEKSRLAEAEEYAEFADKKRREYIATLAPYDGKPIIDIPRDVLDKAAKLIKEAQAADDRWAKLIHLEK